MKAPGNQAKCLSLLNYSAESRFCDSDDKASVSNFHLKQNKNCLLAVVQMKSTDQNISIQALLFNADGFSIFAIQMEG